MQADQGVTLSCISILTCVTDYGGIQLNTTNLYSVFNSFRIEDFPYSSDRSLSFGSLKTLYSGIFKILKVIKLHVFLNLDINTECLYIVGYVYI